MNIIHYFSSSNFWLTYFKQFQSKTCFLVHKIFFLFFWSMKYSASNIIILIMQINNQIIHIHNIYFKFLSNYTHIDQNLLIFKLLELFKKSDKHILLENFNLHHLIWNNLQCFIKHNMINELLYIINETDLQLLISSDIIMWEDRKQSFTMNLIFNIVNLKQQIISYYINSSLKNNSDYYLIFT